jgi:hypothetical protein
MLVGAVVGDQVDDDLDATLVGIGQEPVEVGESPEGRIDSPVVGNVVTTIGHRRPIERRQPESVNAQVGEVVEPAGDAHQVAHAVAVAVGETPYVHLVDHGGADP